MCRWNMRSFLLNSLSIICHRPSISFYTLAVFVGVQCDVLALDYIIIINCLSNQLTNQPFIKLIPMLVIGIAISRCVQLLTTLNIYIDVNGYYVDILRVGTCDTGREYTHKLTSIVWKSMARKGSVDFECIS